MASNHSGNFILTLTTNDHLFIFAKSIELVLSLLLKVSRFSKFFLILLILLRSKHHLFWALMAIKRRPFKPSFLPSTKSCWFRLKLTTLLFRYLLWLLTLPHTLVLFYRCGDYVRDKLALLRYKSKKQWAASPGKLLTHVLILQDDCTAPPS